MRRQDAANQNVDKFQLVPELLKVSGLVRQHLDSYNYFVTKGMQKIVSMNNRVTFDARSDFFLEYKSVRVGKAEPYILARDVQRDEQISPHICRLLGRTYAAPIEADIERVKAIDNELRVLRQKVVIGLMPIMLRSCCCVLYGKDESELARLGECPLDPGGYFVVDGTEKVILMQETLLNNRIITEVDKKGNLIASVTSSTATTRSKTAFVIEKEKIYVQLDQFKSKVPIIVVMKAMGMESEQEIVQMVGKDPRYSDLLLPSIAECANGKVISQQQALKYLEKKVKKMPYAAAQEDTALVVLRDTFIAHVPVRSNSFYQKCMYAAVMLRRMLDVLLNKDDVDDKDYVGNKCFELSGQLLSMLFEDIFKAMNNDLKRSVDKRLRNDRNACMSSNFDILQFTSHKYITSRLERALKAGDWHIQRFRGVRTGVTQVLPRLSFIGAMAHMTKISSQFEKSREVSGSLALQPSQYGMLCPLDTPKGEAKHLALMAHVTTDEEDAPLVSLCFSLGVQDLEDLPGGELHSNDSYLVIINGLILGKHTRPQYFANALRRLRREGKVGKFVSVFVNVKQRCVYVASDGGRVCRPLVIADNGVSRITQEHMRELLDGARTFDDFLLDGLIEYLDVNEECNALIALYESDATVETTHIEIEPHTVFGVSAGLIPYPHHNQSLGNIYQCSLGKQAMGNIAYNQLNRMDKVLNLLVYPQRPLVTTKTIELVGYDKLGAGQNAIVAVMSYSGYDIKDAIVMNKSSLDRGFGRCIVMKRENGFLWKNRVMREDDRILCPTREGSSAERMQALDDDGIVAPGQIIRPGDILINKWSATRTKSKYRSTPLRHSGPAGQVAVVERVCLCSNYDNDQEVIKLIIRETRRPEVGDRFSSRHGQKGVCGTIVQQEDFPFTEEGICPDLIMNPHGFPSHMTVGTMIELLGGKAGVSCAKFHYGTAFGEPSGHADTVDAISATLVKSGFSYSGKDFMYSGITGCPLQSYIFMGPIYYQKSKHMVLDKMHAREKGPCVDMTRQPTEGQANEGLRVGEMERDCLIAYGASMLIYERMMLSCDPYEVQVCRKCGLFGYYNHDLKTVVCGTCRKSGENLSTMKLPYSCKVLFQELQSMNIVPRLKLADA